MKAKCSLPALFAAVCLSTAFHVNTASAQSSDEGVRTWNVSGIELLNALEGRLDADGLNTQPERIEAAAKGSGYIAGVADATSGIAWCNAGSILPHELTDQVYSHLRGISPERLKGKASILVVEGLASIFPCGSD